MLHLILGILLCSALLSILSLIHYSVLLWIRKDYRKISFRDVLTLYFILVFIFIGILTALYQIAIYLH